MLLACIYVPAFKTSGRGLQQIVEVLKRSKPTSTPCRDGCTSLSGRYCRALHAMYRSWAWFGSGVANGLVERLCAFLPTFSFPPVLRCLV